MEGGPEAPAGLRGRFRDLGPPGPRPTRPPSFSLSLRRGPFLISGTPVHERRGKGPRSQPFSSRATHPRRASSGRSVPPFCSREEPSASAPVGWGPSDL